MESSSRALRLLVTGAQGQLGRDVVRVATRRGHDALGLGRAELDITDAARVVSVVRSYRPDWIIHCAAWTAVDDAEAQPEQARVVNEEGSRNVARAARLVGAGIVAVSTDYVFDGSDPSGYAEDAATAPVNTYGATKLAAERAVQEELPEACIARTAWVFGADGANFVRTIAALAEQRDQLEVVEDQVGCPTWTVHLAGALIECAERGLRGIYHLAGAPVATWFDVAQEVVRAIGADCEVRPTTSDRFPRPAPRPACSILRATRPGTPRVGDWRDGVRAVLAQSAPVR